MYLIDNILIEKEVTEVKFTCDTAKCKGACCTFRSNYGAPVLDNEVEILEKSVDIVSRYLSKRSLNTIKKYGVVEGFRGDYSTVCIDSKDCVFVCYEGKVAMCSLEKAYFAGEIEFRKPVSCHLFPIRVSNSGMRRLYFQYFEECRHGIEKGNTENIPLIDSVKEALIRSFGNQWYNKLNIYFKHQGEF